VRKPNGKLLCLTPDGNFEERDAAGEWEAFRKSGSKLLAQRYRTSTMEVDGQEVPVSEAWLYVICLAE
jgi:hypothetical protein